eukprot:TRINITY_DN92809_c0_g1_i1.p1 TRINITY_DN92809_c0_g1~~TRINITY_DN92809_c0_g1_i1.p1  ORF type:complete len:111 (-),score=36.61 TRINITY_DN92809_c0_g1_i1:84-416(-)
MRGLACLAAAVLFAAMLPAEAALPPWWILSGVKPKGQSEDQGSWQAISFSKEQQEQFAIDEHGNILDHEKHSEALKAFKAAKSAAKQAKAAQQDQTSEEKSEENRGYFLL